MNQPLLFRIFYSTFFTILTLILLVLLLITPADAIRQALNNDQLYNVFAIASCYLLTVVLALLISASRLYTTRSVLAAIPKTWIPVEKGDVNKKVRKMIAGSLSRSAMIAWDSQPRIPRQQATRVSEQDNPDATTNPPETEKDEHKVRGFFHKRRAQSEKDDLTITIAPHPVWGQIAHNGWSSPLSPDLANLQYITVILELPHLIEAKAVSLAPIDPQSNSDPPTQDIRAVDFLQRPGCMGLRDYITHLTSIGVITSPLIASNFLAEYENARFSTQPLTEVELRSLMNHFAEVLRSMHGLSPEILSSLDIEVPESDFDDDMSLMSTPRTEDTGSIASPRSVRSRSGSEGTIQTAPSRRRGTNGTMTNRHPGFSTAPATPRSRKRLGSRSPSANSFAQSRRPYNGSSAASSESLRSTSQGSVLKLSMTNDGEELPYTLTMPGVQSFSR